MCGCRFEIHLRDARKTNSAALERASGFGALYGSSNIADDRELTASMVNNYVKHKAMPAPVRKKYTREHLAYLVVICTLKPVLPISTIRQMMVDELAEQDLQPFYDAFCNLYEDSCRETAARHLKNETLSHAGTLCKAALFAKAEQSLALQMSISQSPNEAE